VARETIHPVRVIPPCAQPPSALIDPASGKYPVNTPRKPGEYPEGTGSACTASGGQAEFALAITWFQPWVTPQV